MSLRLTLAMDELSPLFAPGQRLGRYELLRRLAVGGMAEVYLAAAAGPGDFRKVVAIKRLLPQHALDPQLLRMFLDEARLMARLSHPHVPQVTDVDDGGGGEVPGIPYFVMEYVHGTDLRGVLNAAGGPLPLEQALAITCAVAAGLHHAHEHRGASGQAMDIVHRDVSPSNVLVSFDGGVKITDFGVAKWAEQRSHTHHGQLKGKFAHMSPEQCRGEALDRRSDVFALGTLLYEMTTGRPPFSADTEYDLLTQIVSRDAPAPRRPGEIYPAALETIVMKALRRDRNDRYASTQELQLDLESFARERRLVVSPVALAGYLESLFGAQVTEWRAALASGKSLIDHLGRLSGLTPGAPITEGGAAAARTTRTATDAFARARSPEAAAAPPASSEPPRDLPRKVGDGNGDSDGYSSGGLGSTVRIRRAVTIAAAATAAAVLLMVATELTSRWQRSSQASLARLPPLPTATATGTRTATGGSSSQPVSSTVAAPDSGLAAVSGAAGHRGANGAVAGRGLRRGRETSATAAVRAPRREAATAEASTASAARPSDAVPAASAAAEGRGAVPSLPGQERSAPSLVPPGPPGSTPLTPPAPIKVWDPDSPVAP